MLAVARRRLGGARPGWGEGQPLRGRRRGRGEEFPLAKGAPALCFAPLVMQKTKKSVAKRFKLSATGKLIRRTPGFRHLLAAKSTKSKRRASRDKLVAPGHAEALKRCLPFGL